LLIYDIFYFKAISSGSIKLIMLKVLKVTMNFSVVDLVF